MLYCLWNCQLKSNTWNAQQKQPSPPMQGPNRSGPQRMFFFPSLTLSLLVKRCRQCTFTLAYIDHKSPKPDVLLNVLIKPISWVERMAGLQCKPAWGTLLRKKTVVILSSTQSTVGTPHPTHTQSAPVQSQMCFMLWSVSPTRAKLNKQRGGEKKNVFHIPPPLLQTRTDHTRCFTRDSCLINLVTSLDEQNYFKALSSLHKPCFYLQSTTTPCSELCAFAVVCFELHATSCLTYSYCEHWSMLTLAARHHFWSCYFYLLPEQSNTLLFTFVLHAIMACVIAG